MFLDNMFFEEPKARDKFLQWFESRNPRGYDVNKMPEFMAVAIVVNWVESLGIYIDKDTPAFCINIQDYRDSEPIEPTAVIECSSSEHTHEWYTEAIQYCIKNLNLTPNKTINV